MVFFTKHSLSKLKQRGISRVAVKETLNLPDYKTPSYADRIIVYKKFDNRYLKVIYKIEKSNVIVITQYWEKKPKIK